MQPIHAKLSEHLAALLKGKCGTCSFYNVVDGKTKCILRTYSGEDGKIEFLPVDMKDSCEHWTEA